MPQLYPGGSDLIYQRFLGGALARPDAPLEMACAADGWEINAGSFGDFTVEVVPGSVAVEATTRIDQDSDAQVTRWTWSLSDAVPASRIVLDVVVNVSATEGWVIVISGSVGS